jgi:hypothetical protein
MHTRKDGGAFAPDGSDVVASFDAFKVTRHSDGARWRVESLAPWARDMLDHAEVFGIAQSNRGWPLKPASLRADTVFSHGLGFDRRGDAVDFLRELERAADGWWKP